MLLSAFLSESDIALDKWYCTCRAVLIITVVIHLDCSCPPLSVIFFQGFNGSAVKSQVPPSEKLGKRKMTDVTCQLKRFKAHRSIKILIKNQGTTQFSKRYAGAHYHSTNLTWQLGI